MKIFVTGLTGYVGSAVSAVLVREGHAIVALAHDDASFAAATARGATPVRGRLDAPDSFTPALADVDAVIHLAASDNPDFLPVNERAIAAMIAAMPVGGAFVTQGGSLVFGPAPEPREDPAFDPPPFLAGRAALDARLLSGAFGSARASVVYGSFVYGAGGGVFPTALAKAGLARGAVPYPGDGSALWSICDVTDWADLIVRAATNEAAGGKPLFPVAGHRSIASLAEDVAGALGLRSEAVDPQAAFEALGPLGAALSMPQVHSAARAEALGWSPRGQSPREAFADMAARLR